MMSLHNADSSTCDNSPRLESGGFSGNAAPSGVRWLLKAMPWPGTFKNILSGIDITISEIPAERTHMRTYRQRLLHYLATFETLLRGEARVHSDDLMSSVCSFGFKDVEERAPGG